MQVVREGLSDKETSEWRAEGKRRRVYRKKLGREERYKEKFKSPCSATPQASRIPVFLGRQSKF